MLDMYLQDCSNHCEDRFQKVWTMLPSQSKCSTDYLFSLQKVQSSLSIIFNLNAKVFVVKIIRYRNHLNFTKGFMYIVDQLRAELKFFCHFIISVFGTSEDEIE